MVSGAILSGAISALGGSIVGASLTYYRDSVIRRASAIQALHAELCENRDRIEDEIERITATEGVPENISRDFLLEAFREIVRNRPVVFTTLASEYTEVIVAYRGLEGLEKSYESTNHPTASIDERKEDLLTYFRVRLARVEQAIDSVESLWEDSRIRTRFIREELEDPYQGLNMVRISEDLEQFGERSQAEDSEVSEHPRT